MEPCISGCIPILQE